MLALHRSVVALLAAPLFAQGWVDRTPSNPLAGPSARAFPAMCWDAAHGYVLMFGGMAGFGSSPTGPTDTWTWNGTSWTNQFPPTSPVGYAAFLGVHAMAYHAPTQEPLLVAVNSTFAWNGTNWQQRANQIGNNFAGIAANIAMGHDPARSQTVLYVGSRLNGGQLDFAETYVWDGLAWSPRTSAVLPYPVGNPSMTFDPSAGRLLLTTNGNGQSWYWEWTGTGWQQRQPASAPAASGAMATDVAHNCAVMLDGVLQSTPGHTWRIANGSAAAVGGTHEPARRLGAAMAYDPVRGRTVLFGGCSALNWQTNLFVPLGDTWEFDLGAGAAFSPYGTGCAGSRGVPSLAPQNNSLPRIGQTFELHVGNLPFTGPAFLFLGFSNTTYGPTPLPFGLAPLGAPGCSILASGDALLLLTNVLGNAAWIQSIPNVPATDFYTQAFALDPAANALGITSSDAGHATIGF